MSSVLSPIFGTNHHSGVIGAEGLSVALVGPDKIRRKAVASALAETRKANVSEFESYPTRPEEFQWLLEKSFDVIMFDLDGDPDVALDLVERVRASESATIMVYSERSDTKLAVRYMRAGAREYLLLPLEGGVVAEALDRAAANPCEKPQSAPATAGKLLVFVCAKGGCGVTTVACNLAIALAANPDQKTLLIDLALPIGDAALALGISAEYSTEDAFRNSHRLDAGFLKQLLVRHRSGLFVLAAPSNVIGVEGGGDVIDKLIAVARREFDHVIVDVGSRMDLMGAALFKKASTVYMVTLTGVSELRNSNRLISQFFPAGGSNLEVVINRFEGRLLGGVNEDVVTKALGKPVRWKIPEDREIAREMQFGETGVGETRLGRLTLEMASAVTGRPAPQEKKKGFSLKRLGKSVAEEVSGNDDSPSIKIVPAVIARATPDISWPTPAPIACGDALSSAQLNATASAAGTLVYTPGPGSVLPPGKHELSVSFTPADSETYTAAQATVQLAVDRSTPIIAWPKPDPIPYRAALGSGQLCATASVPGRFDYSPGPGEELAAGTHTLSVKFTPTDTESYAKAQATVSLSVTRATPIVEWPAPNPIELGAQLSIRQLCATASIPGRFEYSVAPGTALAVGIHTLTARFTPTEAENYATVEAKVQLAVGRAAAAIAWSSPAPISYGTRLSEEQLCATASLPGKFDYSPARGSVLAAGMHTLSVTFTPFDSANYAATQATATLKVAKATPTLEWPALKPALFGTQLSGRQLCARASVPGRLDYSPAPGEMLAAGMHTLAVTFTPADSANYASAQTTVPLTVLDRATPGVAWSNPDPITYGTPLSGKQLCAQASVPGKFDYSAAAGEVLAAGTHSISVIFSPTDSVTYAKAQATVSLKVARAIPPVDWRAPKPILDGTLLGATQLCATAPVSGRFDYSPFAGVALPPGKHTLSVIFTPADRGNYAMAQATAPLTVVAKAMPNVAWPKPTPIPYGTILSSAELRATASVPGRFDYSPGPGVVLTAGVHTLSVTFTPSDIDNYAAVEATAQLQVNRATPVVAWSRPDPISYGTKLGAKQLRASASVPGKFDYSPGSGVVLAAGRHTLSATFTPADSTNYAAVQASLSVEVTRAIPRIEWPAPQSIPCDTALGDAQLCARSPVPGTFDYAPGPGQVLAVGTHTLSVTFNPADTANYTKTQATVAINIVVKPAPVIAWPDPDPINYGTPLSNQQLRATASMPGRFSYSAGLGEVLAAGTHRLSVTFAPTDSANFATTRATVSLKVERVTPTIDWPAPQSIKPGTPLSADQLAAAAWVPGTFVYSPAADEVLPLGTHTLSVTFIPTDSVNYYTAQAAVMLKVAARAMPVIVWSNPDPIIRGSALGAAQLCATASVTGTFNYSPESGKVLTAGVHTLSVTFFPTDDDEYLPAQAMVELQVEALRDAPRMPVVSRLEKIPERFEESAIASQWPEGRAAADEMRLAPPWQNVPDVIHPQPIESNIEVTEKQNTASNKLMIAAFNACFIVFGIILVALLIRWGMAFWPKERVAPIPVATDVQSKPNKLKRSHRTRAAEGELATTDEAVKPTSVQTEMMHDQLTAPARISRSAPQQVPANAPPPVNFSATGAAALSGGGAMGNVFAEKAPRIVAAAPPAPLAISAEMAMALLIQRSLPVYPSIARQAGISGIVQLQAVISKAGAIENLQVVNGPAVLRQAALDAVRTWRYRPYMVNNEPQEVKTVINVTFSLGR